jgi:hypothetical protein
MFRQGFTCPALLTFIDMPFRIQGYHLLWPAFPDRFPRTISTFGLVPVRSSLLRESRLISFPPGTEIFQFPGFASYTYVFSARYPCGWVSPFGHCRIKACCQLPDTFRRLPRPSSPLTAKASTVCAYSLDHITPSRLRVDRSRFAYSPQRHVSRQRSSELGRIAQTLLRPILSKTSSVGRFIFNHSASGSNRRPPASSRCSPSFRVRSVTSTPSPGWWVWEDSNHRPHPYQGCALTT